MLASEVFGVAFQATCTMLLNLRLHYLFLFPLSSIEDHVLVLALQKPKMSGRRIRLPSHGLRFEILFLDVK